MTTRFLLLILLSLSISVSSLCENKSFKELKKFWEATNNIKALYVDTINEHKAIEYAISGMLQQLDPHSVYIPKEELEKMNEPLVGEFEGIGIQYNIIDDTIHVENTISGGPSEKVGILPDDRIIAVDGKVIAGNNISSSDVMKKIRGPKGTNVKLRIVRHGIKEPIEFNIVRDKIPLHSVETAYMINSNTGYIKLSKFSETTYKEFKSAIEKLRAQGMTRLVFDLRNNGGGYLKEAVKIADEFLDGKQLIVFTKGRRQRSNYYSSSGGSLVSTEVVFLVNQYSASASEILAGAMQDNDRAAIIGRRTYGKGLVQQALKLSDGSVMRLTVSRYYTPSGRCIQKPYKDGVESYKNEISDRYKHGEFTSKDSISFPDSLKYYTLKKKRVVYGGGGIMPDYFVGLDTTQTSMYLTKLIAKGVLIGTVSDYMTTYGDSIRHQYQNSKNFLDKFNVEEKLLNAMRKRAEHEEVEFSAEQYERSKSLIEMNIKALIARRLFDEEGFYRVVNDNDEICKKAMEVLGQ